MNIFQQIEKANYCVSLEVVKNLATEHLTAAQTVQQTHGAYFRILLALTQKEICGKPTLRARSKVASPSEDELGQHLEAFEKVNGLLYAGVLEAVRSSDVAANPRLGTDEENRRAKERNRRSNFARSAASTLRTFIKRGGNVLRLAVPSATKNAVGAMTPEAEPTAESEDRARKRVIRDAERIVKRMEVLAAEDKSQAAGLLQVVMSTLGAALGRIGPKATTKPSVAFEEHRPLKTRLGTFYPAQAVQ
jgi:hypothetical protein